MISDLVAPFDGQTVRVADDAAAGAADRTTAIR